MAAKPNTPSENIIAETPAQFLARKKVKMIRSAKVRFIIDLASCLTADEVLPNTHLLNTIVDTYERGYTDCMTLWYESLKDMDCCLPENRGKSY